MSLTDSEANAEYALLDALYDELLPLCRSITGPGLEASYDVFARHMPLAVEKVPSGSRVFDWTVPPEWHLRRARLWAPGGELVCDSDECNLHVVNYSQPMHGEFDLEELQVHLHSLEHLPTAIPYVTSYYSPAWGFCLSHEQRRALPEGRYRVEIDSELRDDGGVPFAHCVLPGESDEEILLSSYLCHPSLANNELSGPLALLAVFQRLQQWPRRRFSYRFVLNPETIGALCFLSRYGEHLQRNLRAGLVLTCVGGPARSLRYKASRPANSVFDDVVAALASSEEGWSSEPFSPLNGSDERQYCSPGFNLPIGQVARSIYGDYDGYHNSLDDKTFMTIDAVQRSAAEVESLLALGEVAGMPVNLSPYGEPQLGKRGLYPNMNSPNTWNFSTDSQLDGRQALNAMLTVLNMSDGQTSSRQMADACGLRLRELKFVLELLEDKGLLSFSAPPLAGARTGDPS